MLSIDDAAGIVHRSGAAARRANVAPATLRVWERRYSVVDPQRSPSGQRLYSETDVKRLKTLKRLVDRGYAIGTVARLSLEQLEFLNRAADPSSPPSVDGAAVRWIIVGKVLGERLKQLTPSICVQEIYEGLPSIGDRPLTAEIVLIHSPSLRDEAAKIILSLAASNPLATLAVVYSFGIGGAVDALRRANVRLHREPLSRVQLVQLVDGLATATRPNADRSTATAARPARLFSDSDLAMLERQVTSITCECPAHLTALIAQLAAFETYSDGCGAQNAADADLHRQMGDSASQARATFESLLQRIAMLEGWSLSLPG